MNTMTEHVNGNGTGLDPSLPKATELILSNGLKVWVYEINQADLRKMVEQFRDENPVPDPKQFERPVPAEDASFEGQMLSGNTNPDYLAAYKAYHDKQQDFIVYTYLMGFVEFPDYTDDELIAKHAKQIARKRKVMQLPEDPWKATVLHALITEVNDRQMIVSAIEKKLVVEPGEIIDQVQIFRPVDSGRAAAQVYDRGSESQGTENPAGAERDQIGAELAGIQSNGHVQNPD